MSSNKDQQFTERLSTAASARRAMLEQFQARRTVDDPAARERRAAQEALRAARETVGPSGRQPGAPNKSSYPPSGWRAKQPNANSSGPKRNGAWPKRPVKRPRGPSVKPLWSGSEGPRVRPCIGLLSAETRRDEIRISCREHGSRRPGSECLRDDPAVDAGGGHSHAERQSYVPGHRHHGLPEERRHARESRDDRQSRLNPHHS